jgi:hypothetical protein
MFGCDRRARRARLAQEALAHDRVIGEVWRQRLDGHAAIEPCVARQVDDPHSAAADFPLELVLSSERGGETREGFGVAGAGDRRSGNRGR